MSTRLCKRCRYSVLSVPFYRVGAGGVVHTYLMALAFHMTGIHETYVASTLLVELKNSVRAMDLINSPVQRACVPCRFNGCSFYGSPQEVSVHTSNYHASTPIRARA